ncbi:MAG: cysteine--tRNA ligase, partial [Candidatus Omnitrophica bacterium]|nr:cysteine--tRNA ligase [Candidatus Omnitrophota bacterium]
MITIYNTLTRRKEEFKPLEEGKVRMYVCGPTVYDVPHIGHARSSYIFDWIRRYLEYSGFRVCYVRNVTDIDDKIIKKAAGELKKRKITGTDVLCRKVKEVADYYLEIYHSQMSEMGINGPDLEPKATENISQMIEFISVLIEKGCAYEVEGNVYFSVENFAGYGKLSNRDKEQMMSAVRIDLDKRKKYPLDFALWKSVKKDEPFWESPWGKGRPGWHIECSVMSTSIFGAHFDIHGGGLDLIFPHHENEIAQAEAATGKDFANYWIHNGLLTVENEKMAKSLGNYITITDFLKKYKDPDFLKIAFLNSHYRSPMDYSDERMEESRRVKERIVVFFDKVNKLQSRCSGE